MNKNSPFWEMLRNVYRTWKRIEWKIRCIFKTSIVANRFPFDTSVPLPPNAHKHLEQCCKALEDAGYKYTLGWGTALGIYRDKRLIPHDNDFDLNLIESNDWKGIEHVMTEIGWTLGRRVLTRPHIFGKKRIQQLVFYSDDHVHIDYIFWDTSQPGEILRNTMDADYIIEQPKRFFTDLTTIDFLGKTYPIAKDIEAYLACIYGHDWNIPRSSKHVDWRVGCKCLVKRPYSVG